MKRFLCVCLCLCLFPLTATCQQEEKPQSISAAGAVVMDAATGVVLFEKNADAPRPMASTTKIMTTLLLLERGNLEEEITVTKEMVQVEGTSMGLLGGDTVTPLALCYGMMLASGNDAANVSAILHSGSVAEFANAMNQKAAALGMKNTVFVTPSGLDEGNHHSTPYDMAVLTAYALKNPTFREIVGSKSAKLSYGNPPYPRTLSNHNRLLKEYEGCIGVKTGFTKKAGRCLVSAATRGGATLICVTLKAPDDWNDHKNLLDYGFSGMEEISHPGGELSLPVISGEKEWVSLSHQALTCTLPAKVKADLSFSRCVPPFLYAPLSSGQPVGWLELAYKGQVIAKTPITATSEVALVPQRIPFWQEFFENFCRLLC